MNQTFQGVDFGPLWRKVSKKGTEYLSGPFGDGQMLVLPNKKQKDSHPDFRIVIVPGFKKNAAKVAAPTTHAQGWSDPPAKRWTPPSDHVLSQPPMDESDVPF